MSELKVGFCVSGGGALFRSAVLNAAAIGIKPSLLVVEQKASPELEAFCESHEIACVRIPYANRQEADLRLTETCVQAELGLLCLTFDKLIPPPLVDHYTSRVINVHPGLLPAFPGMRAIRQALDADARFVGATIHEVDHHMDHGAIIAQCVHGLHESDSQTNAGARLFNSMRLMYLQVIAWYAEDRVYKTEGGRIRIRGARYGEVPISPSVERGFI